MTRRELLLWPLAAWLAKKAPAVTVNEKRYPTYTLTHTEGRVYVYPDPRAWKLVVGDE